MLVAAILSLASRTPVFAADIYNLTTRQLAIPSVTIGSATYSSVVISQISVGDVLAY